MGSKTLFNFYLDDEVKQEAISKINRLNGVKDKGQLASLIRVYLRQFISTPDDKINPLLIKAIEAEYEYSTKKNKRSNL